MDIFKHFHLLWYISLIVSVLTAEVTGLLHIIVTKDVCGREVDLASVGELYLDYYGANLNRVGGLPYIDSCKITVRNTNSREMTCITSYTPSCWQTFRYYYDGVFYFGSYLTCADVFQSSRCHKVPETFAAFESYNFTGEDPRVGVKLYSSRTPYTATVTRSAETTTHSHVTSSGGSSGGYYIVVIIVVIVTAVLLLAGCCNVCHRRRTKRCQSPVSPNAQPMEIATVEGHVVSIQGNPFQNSSAEWTNNLHMQDTHHTSTLQQTIPTHAPSRGGADNQSDHSNSADVINTTTQSSWDPPTYDSLFGAQTQTTPTYYNNLAYR